jgi:hypothetical protein
VTYDQTQAEIDAGVTPTNYAIPSHDITKRFDILRYGAVSGADNTSAILDAIEVATEIGAGGTLALSVPGLISSPVIIGVDDLEVDGCGDYQQFATNYDRNAAAGQDWSSYNQMFVANANRVFFRRVRFLGNTVGASANYFSGSFVWFAQGVTGGGVHDCYFQNLRYDPTTNSVAIQTRTTTQDVHIGRNKFLDCTGSVSLQGLYNFCDGNTSEYTDAMATAALSASPGVADQSYGTDGSTGCSVINNKVYISSGAPYSGAHIGSNSGATNFVITGNVIKGIRGGVGIFVRASSYGTVAHNVIDGNDYSIAVPWCMLRVDADSSCVDVTANMLKGPPVGAGTGLGLDVYTGGNTCVGNKVLFGSNTRAASLLHIGKATNPAVSVYADNYLLGGGVGTHVDLADNVVTSTGLEVPIIHRNNIYETPVTTPYNCLGVSRQIKFYVENDAIVSTAYIAAAMVPPTKFTRAFRHGFMHRFPYRVGERSVFYANEKPAGANYALTTWEQGDTQHNSTPGTAGTPGWVCVTSGTFPDSPGAYSQAGTSTNGSPIITGLTNTTKVLVGDYVSPSAGFATTGPYRVIAKTSTTITLDTNSNGNNTPTVTHFTPVFAQRAALS